ncbi:DoxX family membrane protein [Paraflavitalea sp. CAU 1676]|uniref:DoxX family membrane protein n=1 Tax=Paraflavitalea sp. CAU 1676 TaxID=3032598 RepID=UPI0023DB4B09|nr:DoxX family membrane protein [Paraflavitalea sp. CAU 1676]MDF2191510.1 DoxX family membrane protein [Paraflavitalea sp. CAU 1676]
MQKLFGWFKDMGGGVGIRQTLAHMAGKKIPKAVAWLVILGQSLGSIGLLLRCFGRIAALANFMIFTGALYARLC